jgi:hypothetical protein
VASHDLRIPPQAGRRRCAQADGSDRERLSSLRLLDSKFGHGAFLSAVLNHCAPHNKCAGANFECGPRRFIRPRVFT